VGVVGPSSKHVCQNCNTGSVALRRAVAVEGLRNGTTLNLFTDRAEPEAEPESEYVFVFDSDSGAGAGTATATGAGAGFSNKVTIF